MSEDKDVKWVPSATEETCCPLCESDQAIVVSKVARYDTPVRNVACQNCGTVYISPRPSESEMAEFYRLHYRAQYSLPSS